MVRKLSKIFVFFLVAIFSLTSFSLPGISLLEIWASGETINIFYDGNLLEFSQPDSIIKTGDNIFLAPAAELASLTGVTAVINNNSISFVNDTLDLNVGASIGSSTILVNGTARVVSAPPQNINGVVMFPVKDFFYTMNCSVRYNKVDNKIVITSPVAPVYNSGNVVIHEAATSPVIDGIGTDIAWTNAALNDGFLSVFHMDEPVSDTSFKVTYDDEAIYLFINCEGAPVPLEAISVYLAPESAIGMNTPYYNAVLVPQPNNTLVQYDGKNRSGGIRIQYAGGSKGYSLSKGSGYTVAYNIKSTSWAAEVKIPYSKLVTSPDDSVPVPVNASEWRFNIIRVRPFTETSSSWVPVRNSIYGDNLIPNDCSYTVTFMYAPTTNRSGSIFFEGYPQTRVFDNILLPCINVIPENAGLRYMGYNTKLVCFDKEAGLNIANAEFYAEWVNELGIRSEAEILNITEKSSKLYFIVQHPEMIKDGLYRLNIYIKNNNSVKKNELLFDRQEVVDAGVIYNCFVVDAGASGKTILQDKSESQISTAAKALLKIMPECIGYSLNKSPAAGTLSYNATTDSLIKTNNGVVTLKITRTKNANGNYVYTTTPSQYANNKSMTLTSRTGKQVTFGYYEDGNGERYFLDAQLNGYAEDYIKAQLPSLAQTDPVGAAYVLYRLAKAYQDWMPKYDYYSNISPLQWNWGPPFGYFSAVFHRWNYEELTDLKFYAPVYATLKNTNALDIVSAHVGEDADELITKDMFHDNVEFFNMFPNQNQNMNYKSWQGLAELGKKTGNPDYVHQAINMVDEYVKNGFLLDGFWNEVTMSYHVQSLNGVNNTIDDFLNGYSDPAGYISPRTGLNVQNLDMSSLYPILNNSNLVQNTVVYPTGRWFPIQDTWETDKSNTVTNLGSILMPAANIARMSKGTGSSTSQLYMTYTPRYGSHCHCDPLSLALWSSGQELLPDLGYTHSQLHQWTLSTLGHNTVVVNSKDAAQPSNALYGGKIENYADIDSTVQIMKARQENAYPGVTQGYDREPWYIKMEGSNDSYILDVFRVQGGNRHEYTLNGDATSKTSSFTANVAMTNYNDGYLLPAGTVVTPPKSETDRGSAVYNGQNLYYAYAMVKNVKHAMLSDGSYEITMTTNNGAANTAGMKITGFAGNNSELFIGKAPSTSGLSRSTTFQTPRVYMPKMVVRRDGTNLQSTFVNIMEPYATGSSAKITSIEKLNTTNSKDVAVKITYPCASNPNCEVTDVIISNSNPSLPLTVGDITLNGKMAFVRYLDDEIASVYTVEANYIIIEGMFIEGGDKYDGKVISTMRKSENAEMDAFVVNTSVPEAAIGKTITITHPDGSVHGYTIASVTPQGENTIIEITGGDPGFKIFEDESSKLLFYPQTSWNGEHTFKIAMETSTDNDNSLNNASLCTNTSFNDMVKKTDECTAITNYFPANGATQLECTEVGETLAYNFELSESGNYQICFAPYTATSYGIYDVYVDGEKATTFDFFGSIEENPGIVTVTEKEFSEGTHTIKFVCTGKDDMSSNYKMGIIDFIAISTTDNENTPPGIGTSFNDMIKKEDECTVSTNYFASNGTTQLECTNVGESLAYNFELTENGIYQISITPYKATSYGIYDVYVDGEKTTTLDFYGDTGVNSGTEIVMDKVLLAGMHTIKFVCTGKNDMSDNYKMGIIDFIKTKTAECPGIIVSFNDMNKKTDECTASTSYFEANGTTQLECANVGETLAYNFELTENGIYQISLSPYKATSYGLYDVYVDGEKTTTFDFYGDTGVNSGVVSVAEKDLSLGEHTIKFVCTGKDDMSLNYKMGIIDFIAIKVANSPVTSTSFNDMDKKTDECTASTSYFEANGTTQLECTNVGETLAYNFELTENGIYQISLSPYKATSYGLYDVYVDGEKATTVDFFGNTGVNSGVIIVTEDEFSEGMHAIKFVCVGKRDVSLNYKMGIVDLITTFTNNNSMPGTGTSFNDMTKKSDECTASTNYFASNGATQFESTETGETLAYNFVLSESGNYQISFTPYKATSYGVYDVYVDGELTTAVDFYGDTGANSGIVTVTEKEFSEGTHIIKFVCVGKRDMSMNYKMGIIDFFAVKN